MSSALAVTSDTFEDEVIKSTVPVLVDFWAVWCGPCKMVAPYLEEMATEYAGKLKVVKVDVDNAHDIAGRFRISSIPTLILFKDGKEVERLMGAYPKRNIVAKVEPHL